MAGNEHLTPAPRHGTGNDDRYWALVERHAETGYRTAPYKPGTKPALELLLADLLPAEAEQGREAA